MSNDAAKTNPSDRPQDRPRAARRKSTRLTLGLGLGRLGAVIGGVVFGIASVQCGAADHAEVGTTLPGADGGATSSAMCPACVTDTDCSGGACVQVGTDAFCAPPCTAGACSADRVCTAVVTTSGAHVQACIPRVAECVSADDDAGATEPGCDGGGCVSSDGGRTSFGDGGIPTGAVTGHIDGNGGTFSRLYFGVVGDTRPPLPDDVAGYPTSTITQIFTTLAAVSPQPTFAIGTGDYAFANANSTSAATQVDLYLGARAHFPNPVFYAMGNHECTGATASNCGSGATDGLTKPYQNFLSKLLAPYGKTDPYYTIPITAADGSWTAKLVFVAANAWSTAQATWLDAELAKPTTYTFVVRHESHDAPQAPGVTPSEQIMAKHPYTLAIVGHTHTYRKNGPREVIIGNGGAPLSSKSYGFGLVSQRSDGAIQVDVGDWQTGAFDTSFRFAVKADGSPAP